MKGKIFLTGGTGSLGKALLARCARECQFTIYSRDEVKQGELRHIYPDHKFILGDVRDYDWLTIAMRGHDAVIHAAAYKQVPAAEVNAGEAIETNVIGSRNVARAAVSNNIPIVVGISSDKACAPINCYGETKALMEKLFQQACLWGSTKFFLTRYGNVLGSRGSVVPLFQEQALRGEITITDGSMTRFWLTLDDAVNLVKEAFELKYPGSILVPMANASTMGVLAQAIAPNAAIRYVGIRPGEKMHEQLIHIGESMHTLVGDGRFIVLPAYVKQDLLDRIVASRHYDLVDEPFQYSSENAPKLSSATLRTLIDAT